MKTFWVITEFLAVLIENWIIFDFYSKFHSAKYKTIWMKFVYFAFICITSTLAIIIDSFTNFSGMLTLICIATVILYGIVFLKGSIFSKFLLPIIAFGLVFIINISISALCAMALNHKQEKLFIEQTNARFFCIITTKLIFFFVTRIILGLFNKGVMLRKQEWIMMSGISFISLFIGTTVVEIGIVSSDLNSPTYIFCFCGIICIDIFVFIMLSQITKQNQKATELSLLELQVEQQKQALENIDIMQNKIRQCNHDYFNHMMLMQEMISKKNYKEAEEYLKSLLNRNPEMIISSIQLPDCFLKSVLMLKFELCKKKNIPISIKADDSTPSCESLDLCILLSNLLDNAIEASEKISDPKIEIILLKNKAYYNIIVKNKIEKSILKNNVNLKTTKAEKQRHGIGIQSIRETVNRYNGMMEYYEKDNWFIANIWLNDTFKEMKISKQKI